MLKVKIENFRIILMPEMFYTKPVNEAKQKE